MHRYLSKQPMTLSDTSPQPLELLQNVQCFTGKNQVINPSEASASYDQSETGPL